MVICEIYGTFPLQNLLCMQYCIVDKNAVYFDNVHSYNDHNTLNTILIHEYNTEHNNYYINRFVAMFYKSITIALLISYYASIIVGCLPELICMVLVL